MKSEQELNELVCGNEDVKKYIYENVPYMGDRIEELVLLKQKYDSLMTLLYQDIAEVLEWRKND